MKPLHDIVFIKADEPIEATKSGILIKEDWKSLPPTGTVEAVGPEVTLVKAGDRVIFMRYSVVDIGDGLRAAKEKHIMGVIEDGES